ncbi:MAG TPA: phosphatase PAP2 family protein [Thermoguttaceae bacterium]|nr:phosphatase PAP2 family protein [Thermoguttaceae bacterium]
MTAATVALVVDCPLAQWCVRGSCPEPLRDLFRIAEPFGHGLGVLLIALAIHQLDPLRRRGIPRLLVCAFGAGLSANVIKLLVVRMRPKHFDFQGDVWATVGGWFPGASAGSMGQSFPSAHMATAVGLVVALTWLYPAGRRYFVALAVLIACQRIETGAHFLSDVLFGAALGYVVARIFLTRGLLAAFLDIWEAKGGLLRGQPLFAGSRLSSSGSRHPSQ